MYNWNRSAKLKYDRALANQREDEQALSHVQYFSVPINGPKRLGIPMFGIAVYKLYYFWYNIYQAVKPLQRGLLRNGTSIGGAGYLRIKLTLTAIDMVSLPDYFDVFVTPNDVPETRRWKYHSAILWPV